MDNKKIESIVKKTLGNIGISKKEKILVALSGGKDSSVTAYLLKKFHYNIEGFHIDLGLGEYSNRCLGAVEQLCELLDIKLHVYDIKRKMGSSMCYLRSCVQSKSKTTLTNCAICGVIKKSILNKEARKLKADKIATGHNLDDEAQTFLINFFKGSLKLSANIGPINKEIPNKKFIPRIKPLFYIPEKDIRRYSKEKKLPVVYEKCPCAVNSYRISLRGFLQDFKDKHKQNIIKNFEKLRGNLSDISEVNYCEICGEPCRGKICKKCMLLKLNKF